MNPRLQLEPLDGRDLPSVTVATPTEAFAYVLVNEMRQDPAGFANQLDALRTGTIASAFGFSSTDPVVADLNRLVAYAAYPGHYAQALQMLRATPAVGALGYDDTLAQRAQIHTQWMETHDFEHTAQDLAHKTYIPGFNSGYTGGSPDQWGYSGQYYWWGEDIGYTYGLMASSKAAYNAGHIGRLGFQERAAFIDTISYILEVNSPDMAHLQQLLRPSGGPDTGTPQFNAIGMDLQFYEAPSEVKDGLGEATISTHRLGLFGHGNAAGFLSGVVFRDTNGNGMFDAGEGIGATLQFSGPTSFTETINPQTSQGIASDYVPNGTYTVTATAADGTSLGSRTVTIHNGNGWFAFRETATAAAQTHGVPAIVSPGTTGVRPTITWNAVSGAVGYRVGVTNVTTGEVNIFPHTTSLGTAWSPPADLIPGNAYTVSVKAIFADVDGTWTSPMPFQVAMSKPSGPVGPVSNADPSFSWSGVSGATRYLLILDDLTTGQRVIGLRTTSTSWSPPTNLINGHVYQWSVAARNAAGLGLWSSPLFFRIAV
jgi:hypothetical protein